MSWASLDLPLADSGGMQIGIDGLGKRGYYGGKLLTARRISRDLGEIGSRFARLGNQADLYNTHQAGQGMSKFRELLISSSAEPPAPRKIGGLVPLSCIEAPVLRVYTIQEKK